MIIKECEVDWLLNHNVQKIKKPTDYTLFNPDYSSSTDQSLWSQSFDYKPFIRNAPTHLPGQGM